MVRYEPGYAFKELNPVQWQCSGTPKVIAACLHRKDEPKFLSVLMSNMVTPLPRTVHSQVLIPVANGSEEMEVLVTVDVLRRANADVVVASVEGGAKVVVARHGTRIVADALLDAAVAAGQQFDLVIVPASRWLSALLLYPARYGRR